jgi:AcrR family transcriptional regulator
MAKRDDIIRAALTEFCENNYDAASVNRIISRSGTSKGTFYHYFRDKKNLYFTIIEDAVRIKQTYLASMLAEMRINGDGFFDMMKAQAKASAYFMRENPELYRFGNRFIKEESALKDEVYQKIMPGISASFSGVIAAAVAGGSFSDRYPADFIEKTVSYLMLNYYDILFAPDETPDIACFEKKFDLFIDFLKNGLC